MSILVGATSACAGAAGSQAAAADLGETIDQSLRFRNASGVTATFLYSTGLAGTSLTDYTISVWVKRGSFTDSSARYILTSGDYTTGTGGGTNPSKLSFNNDGTTPGFVFAEGGGNTHSSTQPLHRDFSAWYHVVAVQDSTANTQKLYVNGTEIGSASGSGASGLFNKSGDNAVLIGLYADPDYASIGWNGYMAEFNFLETALSPTDFGRTNNDGVWVPEDLSGLTSAQYGAAGFRLKFDSSAGLGDDSAPTGTGHSSANDFTASGFETAALSSSNFDNDIDYQDTPTSNYATLNPLAGRVQPTFSRASLTHTSSSNAWQTAYATHGITSGKWYWEVELTTKTGSSDNIFGITNQVNLHSDSAAGNYPGDDANGWGYYHHLGYKIHNGTFTLWGDAFTGGDIIGFAFDADAGVIWASKNGTWQSSATQSEIEAGTTTNSMFTGITGDVFFPATACSHTSGFNSINLGQRDFVYTAPSGYGKLQTNNLPEPTIKNGKEHFGVVTWTGNLTSRSITGLDFQPDFVWIKCRDNTFNHNLVDSVRGADKILYADLTSSEATSANVLTSFNSDGFSVSNNASSNNTGNDYVAWCWKAGGTAVSNTDGTITSSVSANTDAGFSIVSYTGNNTLGATVGHGLSSAPEFIIVKNRDETAGRKWNVYHEYTDATAPEDKYLHLNTEDSVADSVDRWNDTAPTSTVFSLGDSGETNATDDFIAYCWHSVEGFSKIGSYTGNASTDGVFIHTGFKISWLMIKRTAGVDGWSIHDSTRSPSNPAILQLQADSANSESSNATFTAIDFLSNGFKLRTSDGARNTDGEVYIYIAFAEHPTGGENAPPATAR